MLHSEPISTVPEHAFQSFCVVAFSDEKTGSHFFLKML